MAVSATEIMLMCIVPLFYVALFHITSTGQNVKAGIGSRCEDNMWCFIALHIDRSL